MEEEGGCNDTYAKIAFFLFKTRDKHTERINHSGKSTFGENKHSNNSPRSTEEVFLGSANLYEMRKRRKLCPSFFPKKPSPQLWTSPSFKEDMGYWLYGVKNSKRISTGRKLQVKSPFIIKKRELNWRDKDFTSKPSF